MPASLARRLAHRILPEPVKAAIRKAREDRELEAAARAGMVPPQRMWTMVGAASNFVEQGAAFTQYLIEHGRLPKDGAVLDIGCGLGKHAIHLAQHLEPPGLYEGFDVEPQGIEWCKRAITRRYPHARFQHVAVASQMYAPGGGGEASAFRFPYANATFDLAFLASVFTHMFHDDTENYIREIARTLRPGGRCVATMYLLNDARRANIAAGTSAFAFAIAHKGARINVPEPPEAAVAHEESEALAMFERAGLRLAEPVRYGVWDTLKRQDQDFVIVEKA